MLPVCVDMSLYLVGKHCAPAVQRGCGAGGGAVCGSVGAGSSAGAGRSVGGDSDEGFVGGSSVGGDFVGEVDAGGVAGAGASVGSLTADEVSLTDYGRCSPEQSGDAQVKPFMLNGIKRKLIKNFT